jgi:hypothetical protein
MAHRMARPVAAGLDESEQRPSRGARTCWLLLHDAGVSSRTPLTPARDDDLRVSVRDRVGALSDVGTGVPEAARDSG